jgi:hypothetical protein
MCASDISYAKNVDDESKGDGARGMLEGSGCARDKRVAVLL